MPWRQLSVRSFADQGLAQRLTIRQGAHRLTRLPIDRARARGAAAFAWSKVWEVMALGKDLEQQARAPAYPIIIKLALPPAAVVLMEIETSSSSQSQ